jgi:hypothetical protein
MYGNSPANATNQTKGKAPMVPTVPGARLDWPQPNHVPKLQMNPPLFRMI